MRGCVWCRERVTLNSRLRLMGKAQCLTLQRSPDRRKSRRHVNADPSGLQSQLGRSRSRQRKLGNRGRGWQSSHECKRHSPHRPQPRASMSPRLVAPQAATAPRIGRFPLLPSQAALSRCSESVAVSRGCSGTVDSSTKRADRTRSRRSLCAPALGRAVPGSANRHQDWHQPARGPAYPVRQRAPGGVVRPYRKWPQAAFEED